MNNSRKLSFINYQSSAGVLLFSCFILFLSFAFVGCSKYRSSASGSVLRPSGISHRGIRTLCIVELENNTSYPQISGDITESLYQAIQKRDLFDLSLLHQTDPARKNLQINPDSPNTLEQLLAARKTLGVDTILIGVVTSYTPYPHMTMGLHLKLIDLRDGQVVWKTEQIWDTADKAMEEQIKKYFQEQLRPGFSPLDEKLAMLSSINFVKFVSFDVAKTL